MRNAIPVRRGYAMVIVLMFIVLFLAMLGVVCRELAGALRVESLHAIEVQRDEGSIQALARALALLETGLPPTNPYVCGATIDTPTVRRLSPSLLPRRTGRLAGSGRRRLQAARRRRPCPTFSAHRPRGSRPRDRCHAGRREPQSQ